ncbi:MAG: tetratricopeptide repeat protein [Candidatus Thorarchaeota archaeon]
MGWKKKAGRLRTRSGKESVDLLSERIDNLYFEGHVIISLDEVEELKKKENLEIADRMRLEVMKGKCLRRMGNSREALLIANSVIEQGKANPDLIEISIDAYILKAWSVVTLGQLNDAQESIEMGEMLLSTSTEADTLENKLRRGKLLRLKGKVKYFIQMELSLEYLNQAYSLFEEIGDNNRMANTLVALGTVLNDMGKSDLALDYFEKARLRFQEAGNRLGLADVERAIGTNLTFSGEPGEAIACAKRAMMIYEMYDDKRGIGSTLQLFGMAYLAKGELHSALDYFDKAKTLYLEHGIEQDLAWLYFLVGKVYRIKRESDEALKRYEKALILFRKVGSSLGVTCCLSNVGALLHTKGELDSSLKNLKESLEIAEILGNNNHTGQTLYRLISATIDLNDIDQAQSYLQQLQKYCSVQEGANKFLDQAYRVAQSLILKTSRNPRKRAKAEELLEQVVREDVIDIELTTDALLTLCSMLLEDFHVSGDEEVLQDLNTLIDQLSEIAEKQHSYWLLAESYWLQSQIALVELKTKDALQLLSKAQLIAEGHGLNKLALKISTEYDNLLGQSENWERLAELDVPLVERLDASNINEQLERMVKKEDIEVQNLEEEEPIQFLLVAAAGGVNLVTKTFQPGIAINESLVSGFLSALSSFSEEVFSQSLDRVRIGEYTLLMQYEEPFLFCYVFKGQSYSAIQKMKEFIEVLSSDVSLKQALERTITTGAINQSAQASVEDVLTQVFVTAAAN